jgi:two-component system response regulator HydG
MSHSRVLIVHPDPSISGLMTSMLQTLGHRIEVAPNDRSAVRLLEHAPANLVLAGADPEDPDALEFLSYLRRKAPHVPILLVFSSPHPERAREAQIRGAVAVLRFPLPANALRAAVAQALGEPEIGPISKTNGHATGLASSSPVGRAVGQNVASAVSGDGRDDFAVSEPIASPISPSRPEVDPPLGDDTAFRHAVETATALAPGRGPILIIGERGVGKGHLARVLHARGSRPDAPFVEVACGSMKDSVLDVELFGARGGYGAPDRVGKVALARGGTLFLDDVAALSSAIQLKLLRLLRDGEYEVIGGQTVERADVRLVLGSREDLAPMVSEGSFRQDLFHRIAVVSIKLPLLKHRGTDLDHLAEHFRAKFARRLNKDVRGFSPEAWSALRGHPWPGNIRELEEAVERAVVVCRGSRIEPNHLALSPREILPHTSQRPLRDQAGSGILPLKEALEGPEKEFILQALEALNWNRQETARVLDINRTTLYKKMKKYGLLFDEPAWAN